MGEKNNTAKKIIRNKIISAVAGPAIASLLVVAIVAGIASSVLHFMTFTDGTVQEGDEANVPYAVETYFDQVTISADGKINSWNSVKDMWDKLEENNSSVNQYLEEAEDLKKLINAEVATKFLDTRPNPNAPIDWDKLNSDINSTELQGITKLKRAREDGRIITMVYTSPDTLQAHIDEYNETGSEEAKEFALSHFTIGKNYNGTNGAYGSGGSYGNLPNYYDAEAEEGVLTARKGVVIGPGGYKETWYDYDMTQVVKNMKEIHKIDYGEPWIDEETGCKMYGPYIMVAGDVIDERNPEGTLKFGDIVETSLGKGIVVDKETQAIEDRENNKKYPRIDIATVWDKNQPYNKGWPVRRREPEDIPSEDNESEDTSKVITNSEQLASTEKIAVQVKDDLGSSGAEENSFGDLCWPTVSTEVTSNFGPRPRPTEGASTNHGGIDINAGYGWDIYAAESGKVIQAGYGEGTGNMVVIDHGNGYITRYMHAQSINVRVGEIVTKGQVIAGAGSTGTSTDAHLHFEIAFNGQKIDPLTFSYENGMGGDAGGFGSNLDGVTGIGSGNGNGNGSLSTSGNFYAIIATWEETNDVLVSNDAEVEQHNITTYNMTTTPIDYESLVKGYTMPFEFLYALLLVGQEQEFVLDLADLVYDSELEITVLDSLRTNTNIATETYTKKTKVHTYDVDISVETTNTSSYAAAGESHTYNIKNQDAGEGIAEQKCTNVNTIITQTNTVNAIVSYADIWALKYANEFAISTATPIENETDKPQEDIPFPSSPDKTDSSDGLGLASKLANSIAHQYIKPNIEVSASVTDLTSDYFYAKENWNINIKNKVESINNVPGPAIIKEKTDYDSIEPNFVTLFIDEKNNKSSTNIYSATEWLFDIIKHNEKTSDMLDLLKYLLYKATDKNYGVEEFDYSLFNLDKFKLVGGDPDNPAGGGSIVNFTPLKSGIEGAQGQIFDYLLARGVPAAGISAILGWLEEEVNAGKMTWEEAYAQFEDMWRKMQNDNPEFIDALMNAKDEDGLEYAVWKLLQSQGDIIGNSFEASKDQIKQEVNNALKWYNQFLENNPYQTIGDGSDILYWAELTALEMVKNNVYYSTSGLEYYDIEKNSDYTTMKGQDCGGYVASVLYKSGAVTLEQWQYLAEKNYGYHNPRNLAGSLKSIGWEQISPSEVKPGDVVSNGKHVVIYAGGDTYWDVDSGTGEHGPEGTTRSGFAAFMRDAPYDGDLQVLRKPS